MPFDDALTLLRNAFASNQSTQPAINFIFRASGNTIWIFFSVHNKDSVTELSWEFEILPYALKLICQSHLFISLVKWLLQVGKSLDVFLIARRSSQSSILFELLK